MPTDTEVRAAAERVTDPLLRRSLGELGLVQTATVDGSTAKVALAVPADRDELRRELTARVTAEVTALGGIAGAEVDVRRMDEAELQALGRILKGEPAPNPLQVVDAAAQQAPRERVNPFTDARTRVIAISSGKGGVGKSSITTNLSIALAQRGHRVAAVDADVWGFSMPRMLGVERPPDLIDDVIVPPEANGVRLISMGFFAREDQAVVWRGPMLHKALEQFLTDVWWDEPDYLLVDMPPGTGDISISIGQFLPRAEVIVVTTPQPAAQRVAQRAAAMAKQVELDVIGVIENMSLFRGDDGKTYEIFGRGGGQELAASIGVPLLGQVPLVPELREGGDAGRPIIVAAPDDDASVAFRNIAERVDVELAPTKVFRSELKIT